MHNPIYCLSSKPEYTISACDVEERILNEVADYCSERTSDETAALMEWFKSQYKDIFEISKEGNFFKLKIVNKRKFFEKSFESFSLALAKISEKLTFEVFTEREYDFSSEMYNLNAAYDDKYAAWIYMSETVVENGISRDYTSFLTFAEFMRGVKDGDIFYLVSTFDYHV